MKLGRFFKRILRVSLILILLLVVAAVAIPYFFKDQIIEYVKEDINKNVNATVDFADVNLSLFRSFPNFSFQLEQLSVVGKDQFEGYPLLSAENIDLTLDLMSVINTAAPIEIKSVNLNKPDINIRVLRDGTANYDIAKVDSTATTTPEESADSGEYHFLVQLKSYEITEGHFLYDDHSTDVYLDIVDLNHSGSGQFTQDVYDIVTKTEIASLTAKSGGIAYLNRVQTALDMTLNADMPNSKFTLKDNELTLNALKLRADGFVQLVGEKVNMDLKYNTPQNQFRHFLSLIPSAYTQDFKDVEANGKLAFSGFVKGTYDAVTGQLPAFGVDLGIENGDFKYPDLPLGIAGINTQVKVNSPSSDFDQVTVDVPQFQMRLGNNPFEASFKLRTPISDPDVNTRMNGTINLEELVQAFPLDGVDKLNGIITANLNVDTRLSSVESGDYDKVGMDGDLRIEQMDYRAADSPPITIRDLQMAFSPKHVELNKFDAQLGKSDIQAQGTLDNLTAYFSPEKTMTGQLNIRSNLFDANEWLPEEDETTAAVEPSVESTPPLEGEEVFDRFDFSMDGQIGKLVYDIYEMRDFKLNGQVTPNKARLNNFSTKIGKSDFQASGKVTNIFNYLFENETLYGNINLRSKYIDLNEFMVAVEEEGAGASTIADEEAPLEPVIIPEKVNMGINADIDRVTYTNLELRSIHGTMAVADETLSLKDCSARTLGGNFTMNGAYNTVNPEKPGFDFSYKINSFDFDEAFDKLNSFAVLAPIGKFITGNFNSTFNLKGDLGQDMMPNLGSISASGFLQTINGVVNDFEPIDKLGNLINVNAFKTWKIEDTKNWFSISDGKVQVKEFDLKVQGIDMLIGGAHGLDSDMDYNITAKVPRKFLENNAVGAAADKGIKFLEGQASKLGIDFKQGDYINVSFKLTGNMQNPKIKMNLLGTGGSDGSLKDMANSLKEMAVDTVTAVVEEQVQLVKDTVATLIEDQTAKLREEGEKQIAKLLGEADKQASTIREEAKKLSDQTKKLGYEQADKLVGEAGSNFLKKKAAEVAAKKLRKESDKKAENIIAEGDKKAQNVLDKAEKEADKIRAKFQD